MVPELVNQLWREMESEVILGPGGKYCPMTVIAETSTGEGTAEVVVQLADLQQETWLLTKYTTSGW